MSKFIEVLLDNSKSELFNVEHIGHLLPAQVGRCDVFLVTKDDSNNYYGYNLETTYDVIKSKLTDVYNTGTAPLSVGGRKIVKGSFDIESTLPKY